MNLKANMPGITAVFLLIIIFSGFIILLNYQNLHEDKKPISLTSQDANFTLEETKLQFREGVKLFLIVGGIFTILGIIYLIVWIIKQYLNTR
jgi:hypothetical protein